MAAASEPVAQAHWMSLGFIHGVMNTDNMQIAGETIDYGPCAFMDVFHPQKVFSSIDHRGRYAWGNQPAIAMWNLTRLAETMLPLLGENDEGAVAWVEPAIGAFGDRFDAQLSGRFRAKLGLLAETPGSDELVHATLTALMDGKVDFTLFFRRLTLVVAGGPEAPLRELFAQQDVFDSWLARWRGQLVEEGGNSRERADAMRRHNPIFIPRNHRIEEAIQAGNVGDYAPFQRLVEVLDRPFDEQPEHTELERAPEPHEEVRRTFCGT